MLKRISTSGDQILILGYIKTENYQRSVIWLISYNKMIVYTLRPQVIMTVGSLSKVDNSKS